VGVDLSIGDEASLSKGYGSLALRAFVRMLREQGHDTIIIDPDPRNLRAVRAYEKAGFLPVGVMREYWRDADGNWRDGLLMEMLRDEQVD